MCIISLNVESIFRVLEICDSDSADEVAPSPVKLKDYRRQLSYSENENDSVSSEYDPQDIIPPKSVTKTPGVAKPVRKLPNVPTSAKVAQRIEKPKSFLASLCATVPINEAHPDAKKYRQNYKNTKEELCKYLYKLYNEKIFDNKLPEDMTIEWNVRMRGTAGYCYNKRSVKALGGITRSSRMVLATKVRFFRLYLRGDLRVEIQIFNIFFSVPDLRKKFGVCGSLRAIFLQ